MSKTEHPDCIFCGNDKWNRIYVNTFRKNVNGKPRKGYRAYLHCPACHARGPSAVTMPQGKLTNAQKKQIKEELKLQAVVEYKEALKRLSYKEGLRDEFAIIEKGV